MTKKKNKKVVVVEEPVAVPTQNPGLPTKGQSKSARRRRALRRRVGAEAGAGVSSRASGLGKVLASEFQKRDLGVTTTRDGSIWLSKFLDPCHPEEGGVTGVPDANSATVVSPSYRSVDVVDAGDVPAAEIPMGEPTIWANTALPWNLVQICDFSIGAIHTFKYRGDLIDETTYGGLVVSERMEAANSVFIDTAGLSASRPMYCGVTYEFSASITTNQGQAVCAQIDPRWVSFLAAGAEPAPPDPANRFNAVNIWRMGTASNIGVVNTWLRSLATLDPHSMEAPARDGSYFPIRNSNQFRFQQHEFHLSSGTTAMVPVASPASQFYMNPFLTAVRNTAAQRQFSRTGVYVPFEPLGKWDMCASIYWVTGLDVAATFQRTIRLGVEAQIDSSSPFVPFSHPSPIFDRPAMDAAIDIRTKMASAYPADMNLFDGLWEKIKRFAGGVARVVKPIWHVAKPILKPLLPMLPSLLDMPQRDVPQARYRVQENDIGDDFVHF